MRMRIRICKGLLTAFLLAFDGDTTVGLFVRSGSDPAQLKWVVEELITEKNIRFPVSAKSPLATDNLLENTDGVGAPHQCSLGTAPC